MITSGKLSFLFLFSKDFYRISSRFSLWFYIYIYICIFFFISFFLFFTFAIIFFHFLLLLVLLTVASPMIILQKAKQNISYFLSIIQTVDTGIVLTKYTWEWYLFLSLITDLISKTSQSCFQGFSATRKWWQELSL